MSGVSVLFTRVKAQTSRPPMHTKPDAGYSKFPMPAGASVAKVAPDVISAERRPPLSRGACERSPLASFRTSFATIENVLSGLGPVKLSIT